MTEATKRNFLPEEYQFAHEYCFFLHDLLAEIVVRGEQLGIFHHKFELHNESHEEQLARKSGEALAEWMVENGYETEFLEASRRHICVALLADFCHFIFEALTCSEKGKLTVTYALLRKPLKENLFYFEWILADSSDFIARFNAPIPDPKQRRLPNVTSLKPKERLEIIRKATANIVPAPVFSPEFMYELRYDKKSTYGFEVLFQRANHLITTYTGATEEGNLNFIFSDNQDKAYQWEGLYTLLPSLLLYATLVITTVIQSFDEGKLEDVNSAVFRAMAGFALYAHDGPWQSELDSHIQDFATVLEGLAIPCLGCQNPIAFDEDDVRELYLEGIVQCHGCGYKTFWTTNREMLMLAHLYQGRITCPSCNSVIAASEENLASFVTDNRVICNHCQEEIDIVGHDT